MKIKKLISVLICLCLAALTAGCAQREKTADVKIAVIVKSLDSQFWQSVKKGVMAAATEYNVDVTFEGPDNEEDDTTQNKMIENAVYNGADAIVLSAVNYYSSASAVDAAADKGVKIVTIDSDSYSDKVKMFIGTDNKAAGIAAGKCVVGLTDKRTDINIGIVNYYDKADNAILREQGFKEYINSFSGVRVVSEINVGSNEKSATDGALKMLNDNPEINVIIGFNEWTTLGAANAVKTAGVKDTVHCVGFDSNLSTVEMLETGETDVLVVQNPFAIGYLGVKNAAELVRGKDTAGTSDIFTGVITVTKDNMFDAEVQKILFNFN